MLYYDVFYIINLDTKEIVERLSDEEEAIKSFQEWDKDINADLVHAVNVPTRGGRS